MSEFFEAFNPSARHWREQQQLEKMLVVDMHRGGSGPKPLDLDSGVVHLVMPRRDPSPRQDTGAPDANLSRSATPDADAPGPAGQDD